MHPANNYPPACERTVNILDYIATSADGKSIKDISGYLEIPIASAYRLVSCLVSYDVLRPSRRNEDLYVIGSKVSLWASSSSDINNLLDVVHPFMKNIATVTGQACQLCILSYDAAVVIAQELPVRTIAVISALGEKIPINVSAGGKMLLSLYSSEEIDKFLKKAWQLTKKNTIHTVDTVSGLLTQLEDARTHGYSIDIEEYAIGIGCLAVPIKLQNGSVPAALGITGQIDFYRSQSINSAISLLLNVANEISVAMG